MESIQLQFPAWYILLCLGAGLLFAGVLYFRDTTFDDQPRFVKVIMSVLRFVSVALLCALLLSPFIKYYERTTQEPLVVIAQDNSRSVGYFFDVEDSARYVAKLAQLQNALSEKYEVRTVTFGEQVREDDTIRFSGQVTDIAEVINYVYDHYGDRNLGAIVLATDGIYNRGTNPLYLPQTLTSPVHTVALGDTTIRTDVLITRVLHNRIAFLGDRFPVQVDIAARKLEGRQVRLTLQKIEGGETRNVEQEEIRITGDQFFTTREFLLDAEPSGVNRYRVRVSGVSGERNYINNTRDFYVEVIDGRLEVLVLGHSPHPDLAAFQEIIQAHENYTARVELISDFTGDVTEFDLVILHQIPGLLDNARAILSSLDNAEIPRIFVLGEQSHLPLFNNAQELLTIQGGQRSSNEVTAIVDQSFQLFSIPQDLERQLQTFAPLNAPFGEYAVNPAAKVYLYQRIGKVDTQFPLFLFGTKGSAKMGILAAEGLWKWRLYDYLQNNSHDLTNALVNKAIQYVTVKDDKRRFRSSPSKNVYLDNEPIAFDAELYNQSYELINDPEAFLVIRGPEGNEYDYTFNKTARSYAIDIGKFAVGDYTYTAFTEYLGQRLQVNGRFSVQPIQLESYVTTADHGLLHNLSEKYGGELYYPAELTRLSDQLLNDDRIKPVIYQSVRNRPLLHLRWLFAIFALLLGLEWFLRRYFGGY